MTGRLTAVDVVRQPIVWLVGSLLLSAFLLGWCVALNESQTRFRPNADVLSALYVLDVERYPIQSSEDELRVRFLKYFNSVINGITSDPPWEFHRPSYVSFKQWVTGAYLQTSYSPKSPIFVFPEDLRVHEMSDGIYFISFEEDFVRLLPRDQRRFIAAGSTWESFCSPFWTYALGRWWVYEGGLSEFEGDPLVKSTWDMYRDLV